LCGALYLLFSFYEEGVGGGGWIKGLRLCICGVGVGVALEGGVWGGGPSVVWVGLFLEFGLFFGVIAGMQLSERLQGCVGVEVLVGSGG
jgi:hypothetical protein